MKLGTVVDLVNARTTAEKVKVAAVGILEEYKDGGELVEITPDLLRIYAQAYLDLEELKQAAREVCERVVDIEGLEEGLFFAAANELEKLLEAND